ncbi:hypothetical protein GTW25_05785 [Aliihoeflea aestuarii]|jgi:hypothetical protein|uniref:hypothetical protein n=1 Tax=Aliihoeflea aestuarii TaxID=453840 RepID=UPI0020930486|nr:hypothetical protein [Aliihoeflea aestuarii]MCO6390537.1 hypothetical protein [Aliihoeflea aestuarii]
MKSLLIGLPLAGAMMTASLALAQTTPPAAGQPPAEQTAPATGNDDGPAAQDDAVQPERGDCIEPAAGAEASGSTDDMQARLGADANSVSAPDAEEAATGTDATEGEQDSASQSSAETQPVAGEDAGTAPGGSGSSGWTGGLGGSDIGTSQAEELDSSPQQDPPAVASGLDPISGETAIEGPQAPPPADDGAAATPTAPDEDEQLAANC